MIKGSCGMPDRYSFEPRTSIKDSWRLLILLLSYKVKIALLLMANDNLFCIRYSDGEYYRCRVLEKTAGTLVVHYVDYGNCDTVEPGSLLAIPQDLCRLPATALRF